MNNSGSIGILALVLGAVSLILRIASMQFMLSLVLAVIGVVFGIVAVAQRQGRAAAWGLVISVVALGWALLGDMLKPAETVENINVMLMDSEL